MSNDVLNELYQARQHHRRALQALRGGCYEALSIGTRVRLVRQLQSGLESLNRTLDVGVYSDEALKEPVSNDEIECLDTAGE